MKMKIFKVIILKKKVIKYLKINNMKNKINKYI